MASRSVNYVRSFGLVAGMRLLTEIERPQQSSPAVVRGHAVPGYPEPIMLRQTVSDHSIFWQCIVQHQYDIKGFPHSRRLMADYGRVVASGKRPLIIDCGGNIGLSALYFGLQFPEAQIVVVEPDADNFALLKRNTAVLGQRVLPLLGGVWHESGHLRIVNPQAGAASLQVETVRDAAPGTIKAHTIAEICALAGAHAPLIVKIDIEGSQAKLFSANTEWVANTGLVVIELEDWLLPWQGTSRNFFSCMSKHAFEYLMLGENMFCFHDFEARAA